MPCPSELVPCCETEVADRMPSARPGLLRRIYDAVFDWRQKEAERVATAYLQRTGGRLTDDIERRLTDRLITGQWRR